MEDNLLPIVGVFNSVNTNDSHGVFEMFSDIDELGV